MNTPNISALAETHREWARWFVSLVGQAREGHAPTPGEESFVEDEHQCALGKVLDSGEVAFAGQFSLHSVRVLHGTFHRIAGLILQAVRNGAPRAEVVEYQAELARVSAQLTAVLNSATYTGGGVK